MAVSSASGEFGFGESESHPAPSAPKQPRRRPPSAAIAAPSRADAAGFWDLWDELSRRFMAAQRIRNLALPVTRPSLGIETFGGWREFFASADGSISPNSAMLQRDWDHYSARMFQTVHIAWLEKRELSAACRDAE